MERVQREVSGRSRVQRSISLAIAGGVTISQESQSKHPASLGHSSGWNRSKTGWNRSKLLGVMGMRIALKSPRWRRSEGNLEGQESVGGK